MRRKRRGRARRDGPDSGQAHRSPVPAWPSGPMQPAPRFCGAACPSRQGVPDIGAVAATQWSIVPFGREECWRSQPPRKRTSVAPEPAPAAATAHPAGRQCGRAASGQPRPAAAPFSPLPHRRRSAQGMAGERPRHAASHACIQFGARMLGSVQGGGAGIQLPQGGRDARRDLPGGGPKVEI